jgi:flagellar hook-associated protein 2
MGITPLTFTGVSTFSSDFQTILSRAVSIASLPIKSLQNKQADLLQEKQLSISLSSAVAGLAASITKLGNLGANQAVVGTSSNSAKVSVNSTSLTTPVSFQISNITSVAKAASERTAIGYASANAAAVSASGTVRLAIGGVAVTPDITLDVDHNNLNGLRDAINALDAGVTASVINTGTGATPYYLSVSANATGENAIQLTEDPAGTPAQLLTSANSGANAVFQINGAAVTSSSNQITSAVPGITFTIKDTTAGAEIVTLSAATDASQVSSALADFAANYNSVAAQLNAQIGPSAGLLSGNSLIRQIQSALRGLSNYNGSGAIKSLAALGIELSKTGEMSFNQTTFSSLTSTDVASAFTFLGSATTGFGELASTLTQFSDPVNGAIRQQQDQWDATYQRLSERVSLLTERTNTMQKGLAQKLQAADTLLAHLASQQTMLNVSIQSLNAMTYGKQNGNG